MNEPSEETHIKASTPTAAEDAKDVPVLEQDYDDKPTELYTAIGEGNWEKAAEIAMEHPEQVKTWVVRYHKKDSSADGKKKVMWRFLPLHSACARQPSDELVELLLFIYPQAATMRDRKGMLPLHYACGNHSSHTVINMLIIAYPQGAEERDVYGKLPIHHACQWGASSSWVISMLTTVYPESVFELDNSESTPLDLAKAGKYEDKTSVISTLARCASAAAIKAETAALRAEVMEKNSRLMEELEEELGQLKQEKSDIEKKMGFDVETMKGELNEDSVRNKQLEEELAQAQAEYMKVREDMDKNEDQRASTKDESIDLFEQVKQLRNQVFIAKAERDELRDRVMEEIDSSRQTIDDIEASLAEHMTEIKVATLQEAELLTSIDDLKKEKEMIYEEQEELISRVESLSGYTNRAQDGQKVLDTLIDDFGPLLEKQKELATLSATFQDKLKKIHVKRDRQLLELALSEESRRFETTENYSSMKECLTYQDSGLSAILESIQACSSSVEKKDDFDECNDDLEDGI